jgi:hypothetical protein
MTVAEHAANTARAFLAAEIAMTSLNCGAPIVNRTRAEKLLDLYFALLEQAVPCPRTIRWTAGPDPSTTPTIGKSLVAQSRNFQGSMSKHFAVGSGA